MATRWRRRWLSSRQTCVRAKSGADKIITLFSGRDGCRELSSITLAAARWHHVMRQASRRINGIKAWLSVMLHAKADASWEAMVKVAYGNCSACLSWFARRRVPFHHLPVPFLVSERMRRRHSCGRGRSVLLFQPSLLASGKVCVAACSGDILLVSSWWRHCLFFAGQWLLHFSALIPDLYLLCLAILTLFCTALAGGRFSGSVHVEDKRHC